MCWLTSLPIFRSVQQAHLRFCTETAEDGRGSCFSKSPIFFPPNELWNYERFWHSFVGVLVENEGGVHGSEFHKMVHLRELGVKAESGLFGFIRCFWCVCHSFLVLTASPRAGCGRNGFPVPSLQEMVSEPSVISLANFKGFLFASENSCN